jgi:hypothetical protein
MKILLALFFFFIGSDPVVWFAKMLRQQPTFLVRMPRDSCLNAYIISASTPLPHRSIAMQIASIWNNIVALVAWT